MDTRRFPRTKCDFKATLRIFKSGEAGFSIIACDNFDILVAEISEGGLLFLTPYFLPKGIIVELETTKESFLFPEKRFLKGRVVHSKPQKPSGYRCGLEFVDLPEDIRGKIADYVKSGGI